MQRLTAALVLATGITPCAAQWGLLALTSSGDLDFLDHRTGERVRLGSTGLDVIAAGGRSHTLFVISRDHVLHTVDRGSGTAHRSIPIVGMEAGDEIRAVRASNDGWRDQIQIIIATAQGEDWFCKLDITTGAIEPSGRLAVRNVRAISGTYDLTAITEDGRVYLFNEHSLEFHYQTSLWGAGGPYRGAGVICPDQPIIVGAGFWVFDGVNPNGGWRPEHHSGYADIVAVAEFDPRFWADCDSGGGPSVLDIFDFLCFGNRWSRGDPYACDCDLTTGMAVCDIFDFLCFGNAFASACRHW